MDGRTLANTLLHEKGPQSVCDFLLSSRRRRRLLFAFLSEDRGTLFGPYSSESQRHLAAVFAAGYF